MLSGQQKRRLQTQFQLRALSFIMFAIAGAIWFKQSVAVGVSLLFASLVYGMWAYRSQRELNRMAPLPQNIIPMDRRIFTGNGSRLR
jgi:hypothetical protein